MKIEVIVAGDSDNPFCRDSEIIVGHCIDYFYQSYCPKTCAFALRKIQEEKNDCRPYFKTRDVCSFCATEEGRATPTE